MREEQREREREREEGRGEERRGGCVGVQAGGRSV